MKMEKIKGVVTAMIPVALGVAAGMLIYEQVKKQTAGTSSFSNVGGAGSCEGKCTCDAGYTLTKCVWNSAYQACHAHCESKGDGGGAGEGNILQPNTTRATKIGR